MTKTNQQEGEGVSDQEKIIKVLDTKITHIMTMQKLTLEIIAKTQLRKDRSDEVWKSVENSYKDLEKELRSIINYS